MFAAIHRRFTVWRIMRRIDRHVKLLLGAHGGYPPATMRICGPGYTGTLSRDGTVKVRIEGPIEVIHTAIEVKS